MGRSARLACPSGGSARAGATILASASPSTLRLEGPSRLSLASVAPKPPSTSLRLMSQAVLGVERQARAACSSVMRSSPNPPRSTASRTFARLVSFAAPLPLSALASSPSRSSLVSSTLYLAMRDHLRGLPYEGGTTSS